MNEAYAIISKVYALLKASSTLTALVSGVYVQAQRPKGVKAPVVLLFGDVTESGTVYRLSRFTLNVVVRTDEPDGDGTKAAQIFAAIDALLNGTYVSNNNASVKLTRSGLAMGYSLYDEVEKDYFKHWRYAGTLKNLSLT